MIARWICVTVAGLISVTSNVAKGQLKAGDLLNDLVVVEKESAEAKKVRLKWISDERTRVQDELKSFDRELTELKKNVPDVAKSRVMTPAAVRAREREQVGFNSWALNNDPNLGPAIVRGSGLNVLLRVLGPIAHYRKLQAQNLAAANKFESLSLALAIQPTEVSHLRLKPATASGPQAVVTINRLPLELEWPVIVTQNWPDDCKNVGKLRDTYVNLLSSAGGGSAHVDSADLLDDSLELLQAKVLKQKWDVAREREQSPA